MAVEVELELVAGPRLVRQGPEVDPYLSAKARILESSER